MKDIICECGHSVTDHSDFGKNGCILCKCNKLTGQIYRAHIAKLEAVVEAGKVLFLSLPVDEIKLAREVWGNTNTRLVLAAKSNFAAALEA